MSPLDTCNSYLVYTEFLLAIGPALQLNCTYITLYKVPRIVFLSLVRGKCADCVHTMFSLLLKMHWQPIGLREVSVHAQSSTIASMLRLYGTWAGQRISCGAVWVLTALLSRPNFVSTACVFIRTQRNGAYFVHVQSARRHAWRNWWSHCDKRRCRFVVAAL